MIIMDSIINPNVDIQLKKTKLIQLVILSSIDNYIYDNACVNDDQILNSLDKIIDYIKDDFKNIKAPSLSIKKILNFESPVALCVFK